MYSTQVAELKNDPLNLIVTSISVDEAKANLAKIKLGLIKAVIASDLGLVTGVKTELHESEIVFRVQLIEPTTNYMKIIGRI